jgi:hypothetical protein
MSEGADANVDQIDFVYSPEQPTTAEQRIEVLELQVAEMREQIGALAERLTWFADSQAG